MNNRANTSIQPPLIRRIYLPDRSSSCFGIMTIGVVFLATVVLGEIVAFLLRDRMMERFSSELARGLVTALTVACGVVPPISFLLFAQFLHLRLIRRPTVHRDARLERLPRTGAAVTRLAHRQVERVLRSFWGWNRKARLEFAKLPPGTLLLIDPPRDRSAMQMPIQVSFEPLRIGWDDKELEQLAATQTAPDPRQRPAAAAQQRRWHWTAYVFSAVYGLMILSAAVWFFRSLATGGVTLSTLGIPTLAFGLVVAGAVFALTIELSVRWFVVPGALVHWSKPALRRRSTVTVARIVDSAIACAWSNERILAAVAGTTHEVECGTESIPFVLAALLSPARCPTDAELAAWFGPDARIVSGATRSP